MNAGNTNGVVGVMLALKDKEKRGDKKKGEDREDVELSASPTVRNTQCDTATLRRYSANVILTQSNRASSF